jgi:hypothetical protein
MGHAGIEPGIPLGRQILGPPLAFCPEWPNPSGKLGVFGPIPKPVCCVSLWVRYVASANGPGPVAYFIPASRALRIASARSATWSLLKMFET